MIQLAKCNMQIKGLNQSLITLILRERHAFFALYPAFKRRQLQTVAFYISRASLLNKLYKNVMCILRTEDSCRYPNISLNTVQWFTNTLQHKLVRNKAFDSTCSQRSYEKSVPICPVTLKSNTNFELLQLCHNINLTLSQSYYDNIILIYIPDCQQNKHTSTYVTRHRM